jgi:hypothetical protein
MEAPTFRPTRAEFACFLRYIDAVEKHPAVLSQGCCKVGWHTYARATTRCSGRVHARRRPQIIPPAGWASFDYDAALQRVATVSCRLLRAESVSLCCLNMAGARR